MKAAQRCKACASLVRAVTEAADEALAQPIAERVYSLDELARKQGRNGGISGREHGITGERLEIYALSMADFSLSGVLERELPVLAAATALTGEKRYAERCVAQLEEVASWSPLQRPGWACYLERVDLPRSGKEQAWLATGQSVRAIVTALDILPDDAVSDGLRSRLRDLLQEEVRIVCDDWKLKRSWFVDCHNPITNQWVLPTEGLIRACLWLKGERNRAAYELGVANMIEALESHNPEGAFEEGLWYGAYTLESMSHAARAMAVAGDDRVAGHPYLSRCAEWMVQCIQPAGHVMNAFDNILGRRGGHSMLRPRLTLLADGTGSEIAMWALERFLGGPSPTLAGLATQMRGLSPRVSPLHAAYHGGGACVLWRSSWEDDATGVWIRGGHPKDQHDHRDRGHVNVILRGRPALMEAGTPMYDHPKMGTHFASALGHNLLQIGSEPAAAGGDPETVRKRPPRGWQRRGEAPFLVHRLDDSGGDVTVDPSACYDEGVSWTRRVWWSAAEVLVSDRIRLTRPDVPQLRWHLAADVGAEVTVEISDDRLSATVRWPGFTMEVTGSVPLAIGQEVLLDATLAVGDNGEMTIQHEHPGIVVSPYEAMDAFCVDMRVSVSDRGEDTRVMKRTAQEKRKRDPRG